MKLSKDGWGGLAVLAASLFLIWLTLGLRDSPLVPIGPGFYPRIVLGLTALLAAALVVFDLVGKKTPPAGEKKKTATAAVVLHFTLFGLYAVSLPWLGFRVATFAYVAATNALLDVPRSSRGWLRVALLALGTVVATYYTFEHYLLVLLPRGRWTGF